MLVDSHWISCTVTARTHTTERAPSCPSTKGRAAVRIRIDSVWERRGDSGCGRREEDPKVS